MPRFVPDVVLDLDPVLALLADRPCPAALHAAGRRCTAPGCDHAIADTFGVDRRTVQRWKHDGISIYKADELAVELGTHASLLWGSAYYDAIDSREASRPVHA